MLHTITFSAPAGSTAKAIPADPSIPFSHYTDYGISAAESVSQPGTFTITIDDTEYLRWWIFLGASDPTAAEDNHAVIDLSQGPLVEQYDTASSGDSYNRFAVTGSGVTPNIYAADIGLAVSGTGNSREWQWTVASKDCVLFRSDVPDGTMRWIIEWDAGTTFFLGPTASSPLGTYTKQGTASTVTLAKKQIARKAWRYTSAALTVVTPPGDPSPIVVPPGGPGKSTGWALCIGTDGEPVEDKRVYGRIVRGRDEAGNVYDGQDFSAESDEDGVVTFEGLIRGARYEFWGLRLGRGKAARVTVPDDESFQIPDLII